MNTPVNFTNTRFNSKNDGHETGFYPMFLGQPLGVYDDINQTYPVIQKHYEKQVSYKWTFDEVNLEQSRMDMLPGRSKASDIDIMVKTLALLWELDSVASRSIISLFAPFISNSELTAMLTEFTSMEVTHALTYSFIIRNCVPDPKVAMDEVYKNDEVLDRSQLIIDAFDDLSIAGSKYNLGMIKDSPELKKVIIKGLLALNLLEKVQFMSSFAIIFAMAESNRFIGIASLVQLIAKDELLHAHAIGDVIRILRAQDDWNDVFVEIEPELQAMVAEIVNREMQWNEYIFSEGRNIVGLNKNLLNDWVFFQLQDMCEYIGLDYKYKPVDKTPITWMTNWLDINRRQTANQETDNINYQMNSIKNDLDDDEVFDI